MPRNLEMLFQKARAITPRPYRAHTYSPEPADWRVADTIDWHKNIIVEVGCGTGDWILQQAARDPDSLYIGIERTQNKSRELINKVRATPLTNLRALRANAIPFLHQKFPQESIDVLYFFYPNPMPKRAQANQRFFVSPAFTVFDARLKKNGRIYLVSNIEDYVLEARDFLKDIWGYSIEFCSQITEPLNPRTGFERKYLERGENIFALWARKIQATVLNVRG